MDIGTLSDMCFVNLFFQSVAWWLAFLIFVSFFFSQQFPVQEFLILIKCHLGNLEISAACSSLLKSDRSWESCFPPGQAFVIQTDSRGIFQCGSLSRDHNVCLSAVHICSLLPLWGAHSLVWSAGRIFALQNWSAITSVQSYMLGEDTGVQPNGQGSSAQARDTVLPWCTAAESTQWLQETL